MDTLHLNIISPERIVYDGKANRVTLPGTKGLFTILPHHAPIVSSLRAGRLVYWVENEEKSLEIQSGFVEMSNECVSVCIE